MPNLDLDVECGLPFFPPSCLVRCDCLLNSPDAIRLRVLVLEFIERHSDHRSVLDYFAGLFVQSVRQGMRSYYDADGAPLKDLVSEPLVEDLDRVLHDRIRSLCVRINATWSERVHQDRVTQWKDYCREIGADPFWFVA